MLINCDLGKETQVVKQLQALDYVKEVQATNGVYDVIAKLESENENLAEIVRQQIQKIKPVTSVLTLESE